eukprot:507635-Pelagomonas_calceolata.AAC.1
MGPKTLNKPNKQRKLINSHPKTAHKEMFKDKNAQSRAGLQALRNPENGHLETEPRRIARIIQTCYSNTLRAVNIKTGKYLPEEAPRCHPWEQADPSAHVPDPFTL